MNHWTKTKYWTMTDHQEKPEKNHQCDTKRIIRQVNIVIQSVIFSFAVKIARAVATVGIANLEKRAHQSKLTNDLFTSGQGSRMPIHRTGKEEKTLAFHKHIIFVIEPGRGCHSMCMLTLHIQPKYIQTPCQQKYFRQIASTHKYGVSVCLVMGC